MRKATSTDAERGIVLLSAAIAARRELERERAWQMMSSLDWVHLAHTLRRRRLLGALGPRVINLADGRASEGFVMAVEHAIEEGRRQGALLQMVSAHLTDLLGAEGIPCAPLKGPVLGELVYGDPGRRPAGDIDLLVAPTHLQEAVKIVRGVGYAAPVDHLQDGNLPLLHFALAHERGELPPVELHWRIHWYERTFAQEHLLPPKPHALGSWRPTRADELASLLLFYARDGFLGLRLASDLSAWWDRFSPELGPTALDEIVDAYPALARVLRAAAAAAESVVGIPAARLISARPRRSLREGLAVRLTNPDPRDSEPQLHADMSLVDGLLAPRGDFRAFVSRQLLPPAAVLAERARQTQDTRGSSRLGHGARVLTRFAMKLTRTLVPPLTSGSSM